MLVLLYIYNKTSIKRNIHTIKKMHREVGRAKDLSAPQYLRVSALKVIFSDVIPMIQGSPKGL